MRRSGHRPALPRARREPGERAARRGVRVGARRVLHRRGSCATVAAGDVRRRRASPDARRRRRDAARSGSAARAGARGRARSRDPDRRASPRGSPGARRYGGGRYGRTRLARRSLAALELLDGTPTVDLLLDLSAIAVKGRGKERFAAYEDGALALEQTALNVAAVRDRDLLQELLELFGDAYQAREGRESALDFEDLQLRARDLLRDHGGRRARAAALPLDHGRRVPGHEPPAVRDRRSVRSGRAVLRRRRVPVDLPLPARGRRRSSRSAARSRTDVLPLRANYRSRPELLEVVNELFASDFGDDYAARSWPQDASPIPPGGPAVELLVTDKQSYKGTDVAWRRGEARAAARRVRELCDAGEATPGDVVFLFAAGTDADVFEEELRAVGLPTYRAAGRGYFAQQQCSTCSWRTCVCCTTATTTRRSRPCSPRRSSACRTTRSSCCGARPAVVLSSPGSSARCPPSWPSATSSCSVRSGSATTGSSHCPQTAGLERLIDQIVSEHDYDLAVLAQRDGRRRYANIRKLGRLARSFEDLRGRDVEGFVRFVADRQRVRSARDGGVRGGGGLGCGPAADDPCGEGSRVPRSSSSPTRAATGRPAAERRSSAARRAASASRCCTPADGRSAKGAFDYDGRAPRGGGVGRGRAAAPLLRRDDAGDRSPARLRARSIPRGSRTSGRRWRGCSTGSAAAARRCRATSRRRRARGGAAPATRRPLSAAEPSRSSGQRGPPSRRGGRQLSLFCVAGGADRERRRPRRCRRSSSPSPASLRAAPALVQRARDVRGVLVRSSTRATSPGCASAGSPPQSGSARRRRLRGARGARAYRSRRVQPSRGRPRASDAMPTRRSSSGSRASSRRTATRSSPRASRRSRARRKEQSFSFEHDGVVLHGFIDVLRARRARARRRLQDERARGTLARGGGGGGLPAPAARLRARVLPRRRA